MPTIWLGLLIAALQVASGADWPQWRGPARDGSIPAASAPTSWPQTFARVWRVQIGDGYASPVVSNGRVFVHSRTDPDEIVTAVNAGDGKVIWQQRYPAAFT